jgi:hypothetical protein
MGNSKNGAVVLDRQVNPQQVLIQEIRLSTRDR